MGFWSFLGAVTSFFTGGTSGLIWYGVKQGLTGLWKWLNGGSRTWLG